MNTIPLLGIEIHHPDGHQILPPKPNPTPSPESVTSRVNLIVSTTLPSHKGRIARAKVATPGLDGEFLFEPDQGTLDHGLTTLESVVTARRGEVLLPIDNYSGTTLHLKAGEKLGTLRSLPLDPPLPDTTPSTNAPVKAIVPTLDRSKKLLDVLQPPLDKLSPEEGEQLTAVICEFADVFALDDTELG